MADPLRIFTLNFSITVKTLKTAVKLASLLIAVVETAQALSRTFAQDARPELKPTKSTTLTWSEESSIELMSTQSQRRKRRVVDKIET